ncbi:MAG: MBL fold metallo-hydrolase [Myxococcota bacterium]|nr:MBL fold metallo-hydrolase [Myxococcota bacterium]MEE2780331.1 MBL fold metallo-hydrolase [Myxococcota bacterium]
MNFFEFPGCDFRVGGFSLGGLETAVVIPEWRLAVDVGRGRRELNRCDHIALTHTHMDHAGGLPYVLATRKLLRMPPPTVYVPAQMADELRDMLTAWGKLQRFEMHYELVEAEAGVSYPLRGDKYLVPFRTHHPVPSMGYTVVREVKKLKEEFHGLEGPEIARRRKAGEEVTRTETEPLFSVSGDTLPEALDNNPEVMDSRVVIFECTFLTDDKPYQACRDGGHTHLKDLMERSAELTCDNLMLSHFSQIHRWEDVPSLLAPLAERISGDLYAFPTTPEDTVVGPIGG